MSIKKLGAAIVAVLALTALAASSASAAVETKAVEWYTGPTAGTVTTLGTDTGVTASLASPSTLATTILGTETEIKATGLECLECNITNEEVTEKLGKVGVGDGKIRFTGVTVTKPANCTVRGIEAGGGLEPVGQITTRPLKVHADWQDAAQTNKKAFLGFFPTAGRTTPFAGVKLEGGSCIVAGNYNVTGSVYGESTNNIGTMATVQPLNFSAAVQSTTGANLKFGTNPATLTGTANFAAMGAFFGVK